MFWRMLWAVLTRRRARAATTLLAVALGSAVLAALGNVHLDATGQLARQLRAYGANVVVTPRGDGPLELARLEAALAGWEAGGKLVGAAPHIYGPVRVRKERAVEAQPARAILNGSRLTGLQAVHPSWRLEGAWPEGGRAVVLGAELAERLYLRPGERIVLDAGGRQVVLPVTGLLTSGEAEDDQVLLDLALAQEILGRAGEADGVALSVVGRGQELEERARELEGRLSGAAVRPVGQVARAEEIVLRRLRTLILLVGMVMTVSTFTCLVTTMASLVRERRREMGLKKALGAGRRELTAEFVAEGALLGLAGGLAGLPAAYGLTRVIGQSVFGAAVAWRWAVVPAALVLSAALAAAAAWWPVRAAAEVRPAEVLRGD